VPNVKKIRCLNLPGTPWATSAYCGRLYIYIVTVIIGFILLVVKILYLIDWAVVLQLTGMRVRESERMMDRERE